MALGCRSFYESVRLCVVLVWVVMSPYLPDLEVAVQPHSHCGQLPRIVSIFPVLLCASHRITNRSFGDPVCHVCFYHAVDLLKEGLKL